MSTRYVYDVYNTTASARTSTLLTINTTSYYTSLRGYLCNDYNEEIGENRDGEAVTVYDPSGASRQISNPDTVSMNIIAAKITDYAYATVKCNVDLASGKTVTSESYLLETSSSSGAYWHAVGSRSRIQIWTSDNSSYENIENANKKPFYVTGGTLKQGGTLLRTESSPSRSKTEGAFTESGQYRWRAYRGSDTIDPTAVTYSTNDLYPNESVTITVTPVTPTYGGIIYYQYQYSTNGGSTWTNLGSRTTDTSKTMTIPEGATQFRARVTASDGWGFTSTTPVLGANLGVSQLKAFATINALHRSGVKMYATVDGKIREITKGYATVDGVIHKMF